jgi:hypothetical protein
MTRTVPARRITLHLSQILFTEARTFIYHSAALISCSDQTSQDPAPSRVCGRKLNHDSIPGQKPYARQACPSRRVGHHLAPAFQLHPKERVRQRLKDSTPETARIVHDDGHTKAERASPVGKYSRSADRRRSLKPPPQS